MTTTVSLLSRDENDHLVLGRKTRHSTRKAAMAAAKKAAGRGAQLDRHYGPGACAYRGKGVTALIVDEAPKK